MVPAIPQRVDIHYAWIKNVMKGNLRFKMHTNATRFEICSRSEEACPTVLNCMKQMVKSEITDMGQSVLIIIA